MGKLKSTSIAQRATEWRSHLARHAASDLSISAFCRNEGLSEGNFYFWRKRLQTNAANVPPPPPVPFIDLGSLSDTKTPRATAQVPATAASQRTTIAGLSVRIDLGDGMVLTIARH